ncbi:MAG TPA: hypothetical protein VIK12_02500, partial [Pengzhenrongella sp.]
MTRAAAEGATTPTTAAPTATTADPGVAGGTMIPSVPSDGRSRAARAWHRVAGWWHFAAAAAIALAAALWTYRPWAFGSAAMFPNGDALAVVAWVQNVVETGWYESGDRLSAPFAQNVHPFTVTDELFFAAAKVLEPLIGSPSATVMWMVVLSFPAAALTAVLLARHLGISKVVSVLVGVAFAVHIDHFMRGFGHYQLAMTYVIPLGVLAAVSLIHPPHQTGRRRIAWEAALLVGLVATGFTSAYYAVFSGVLVAAAGVGAFVVRRSWRDLALMMGRGVALAVPVLVGVVMDKAYLPLRMGYEAVSVTRGLADAELYGGKVVAMLMPSPFHRVGALSRLRSTYDTTFPQPAEHPSLGVVAAVGFVGLIVWAILRYWRPASQPVLSTLAALTWVSLFVYVVGGLGTLWSVALDGGGLRVWSRMHIVIMLLSLLAVAVVVDRLRGHWRTVVTLAVTCVALVDGTSPAFRPDPVSAVALQDEMITLTGQIAAQSPPDAAVFQYPPITFPVHNRDTSPASAYDGFIPYLYSDGLRWSYGGLQGDPATDWQQELAEVPLPERLALVRAGGFAGVLVDTAALTSTPAELEDVLGALGAPDLESTSGRWLYFGLDEPTSCTPDVAAIARDLAVRPAVIYAGPGLARLPRPPANAEGDGVVRLVTLREQGWESVAVRFELDTAAPLRVEFPDGSTEEYAPGLHQVRWTGGIEADDE